MRCTCPRTSSRASGPGPSRSRPTDAPPWPPSARTTATSRPTPWTTWCTRTCSSRGTALAQGKQDEALGLMRNAADVEDRNEKHIVTPGRILPARELLGDMLLQLKRPADALKEFETVQAREPERFRTYYGAAQAAAQ